MFSCEFCQISKNTFFTEHLWATAPIFIFVNDLSQITRKASRKIDALARATPDMNISKRCASIKSYVFTSQFTYLSLTWTCCKRENNAKICRLPERYFQVIYWLIFIFRKLVQKERHRDYIIEISQQTFVGQTSSASLQRNNFTSSKTSWRCLAKTSWTRLEHVFKTSRKTSWRRLEDVLEDEKLLRWRRLQDMSWRRLEDISWRRLQDVLEVNMFTGDICI